MTEQVERTKTREAVGVFDDAETLQAAADELMSSGFDRAYLSLLAGDAAVAEKIGHLYERIESAEDDPDSPRTAYISVDALGDAEGAVIGSLLFVPAVAAIGAVVASGGTLAAAIAAAAAGGGAGGLLGSLLARFIDRRHADQIQSHIERGGLLLWVRTPNREMEQRAVEILRRHSAHDVHVHALPAA